MGRSGSPSAGEAMRRGYVVVHQQAELDVVVGRHGDLADGDEEEDALRVSY